ncbi:hypothetical protein [uncultured Clostridium sp.]|uniref:hypothetical protein n=1 Tax=uncultured Clostridium sp. TaxID=59620 RepID=UPI002600DA55|nr:hypothetical protein [uncultured Clostridium sp.]
MKKSVCFILLFLICFSNNIVLGKSLKSNVSNQGLIFIEEKIYDICFFENNGVKVRYSSDKEVDKEKSMIIEKIKEQDIGNIIEESYNELHIRTSINEDLNIKIYKDLDKTIVEEEIINYSSEKKISKLMKELTELQTKYAKDIRYFQYIKGKINNKNTAIDKIKKIQEMKNINTLDIHNGYVGTANLYNGERVNFSVCTYNTGSYLVIGTPVIFTTY